MKASTAKHPEPLTYTIPGVMTATSLGKTTVYQLMRSGVLVRRKVGKRTLVCAESVRALVGGES